MFDVPPPLVRAYPAERYPELAYALATVEQLDEDRLDDFLAPFDITPAQFDHIRHQPAFLRAFSEAQAFVKENGANKGFKVRSRFYAERLVDEMYQMAKNPKTDPALRLKLFESIAKYADLDPSGQKKMQGQQGAVISINIGSGIRGISDVGTLTLENEA